MLLSNTSQILLLLQKGLTWGDNNQFWMRYLQTAFVLNLIHIYLRNFIVS